MAATYPGGVVSLPTRTDGQTITAAWFNVIHDEIVAVEGGLINGFSHVVQAPDGSVTAPGLTFTNEPDCGLYKEATNAIAVATAGVKALGIDATQFVDSPTQPRASAYMNTTQALDDDTSTALTLNTEDFDVATMHDTGSNTSRMTIPTGGDGLYLITGQVSFAGDSTGFRRAQIMKGGATELAWAQVNAAGSDVVILHVTAIAVLAAADYVELYGRQTSGGALNSGSASRHLSNILQIVKLW